MVNTYSYDPYGTILTLSETVPQPFKFAGAYYDAELTLYKMGARYYDPRIGRFLQSDPAGMSVMDPTTWDLYAYAGNNPVNWTDPTGMFCFRCVGQKVQGWAHDALTPGNRELVGFVMFDAGVAVMAGTTWALAIVTLEGGLSPATIGAAGAFYRAGWYMMQCGVGLVNEKQSGNNEFASGGACNPANPPGADLVDDWLGLAR